MENNMENIVTKPKWYCRFGLECYQIIEFMCHKLKNLECVHMANHIKYSARFLEKHTSVVLQKQDLEKANETWKSFYAEASKRYANQSSKIMPDEYIDDPLVDED
jgi:hypothetical protein